NLYQYWGYHIDTTIFQYILSPKYAVTSISFGDVFRGGVLLFVVLSAAGWLYMRSTDRLSAPQKSNKSWIILATTLLLSIGSTMLGDLKKVHFSSAPFANQVAVSPIFSLCSSIGGNNNLEEQYKFFDKEEGEFDLIFTNFQWESGSDTDSILNTNRPNIAIVICESFSNSIMNLEVDGKAVMPNMKRLADENIFFEKAIATGSRTDKGLVSILSGFPSTPKVSILNTPEKSGKLPSLASTLAREGYNSNFYYGGDINFMNMQSYLSGNGWNNIVSEEQMKNSAEKPQRWGYSDGVMVKHFTDELIRLSKSDEPFLATLLTLSSHEPFDVPESMGFSDPQLNSMAYSDAQLGAMYDQLRNSEAWGNLLLIIVADHATNYPKDINYNSPARHHIPMIFCGGAVTKSGTEPNIISQLDIPTTILEQMDIDSSEFIFGHNHFEEHSGRTPLGYYTFNNGFGIVCKEGSVVYDATTDIAGVTFLATDNEIKYTKGALLSPKDHLHIKDGKCLLQKTFEEIEKL
ncbi:MAG: LTA synthase family protein, partial [Rikenellaceae bacterium]